MSSPKINIRTNIYDYLCKHNLMAVNYVNPPIDDNKIYMPSEISHLISKIIFDSSIYSDTSRLFKISNARDIKMVQIILIENLCDEELLRQKLSLSSSSFDDYMDRRNYSEIDFITSSSWYSCGIEEFLTLPIKSLSTHGAEIIVNNGCGLNPRILLSTPTEMFWDGVPRPGKIHLMNETEYIFSQNYYTCPDNDPANILAIDCEMVSLGDMTDLALARVSVVRCSGDYNLRSVDGIKSWLKDGGPFDVMYDQKVRPHGTIVDYLTRYSGITKKCLENVTLTIDDVRTYLKTIIKPDTIIVGHSVQMDLKALRLYHPYIIDTSTIYNSTGNINRKPALVALSQEIIKKEIRKKKNSCGHDSVEDAYTALKLTMIKLANDINQGNKARVTYFNKTQDSLIGEWRDVPGNKEPIKEKKLDNVELCRINFTNNIEETAQSVICEDIQKKMDKFNLLTEHPAVVKIPELMYANHKHMKLIVNVNGTIGRLQAGNNCKSVLQESSDGNVAKRTIEMCKKSTLLISVLSDFGIVTASSSAEERLTRLQSLQDNIEIIVNDLPSRSAVLVILSGQNRCESTGKLYWKIK